MILFWALFDQIGTLWQVQARELDRIIPQWVPLWGGYEIAARSGFSGFFNPLFILLLVPIFSKFIYPCLSRLPCSSIKKMGIGLWLMVLAFALVSIIQELLIGGHNLHIFLADYCVPDSDCIRGYGFDYLPEFAYTQSPKSMKSLVMALFLLTVSLGNYLTSAIKFLLTDSHGQSVLDGAQEFFGFGLCLWLGAQYFIPSFLPDTNFRNRKTRQYSRSVISKTLICTIELHPLIA